MKKSYLSRLFFIITLLYMKMTCRNCAKQYDSYYEGNNGIVFVKDANAPKVKGGVCGTCNYKIKRCMLCPVEQGSYQWYLTSTMGTNKWSKEFVCPEHLNTNPSYKKVINYAAKAENYIGFIGNPLDSLYLGVELEIELNPDSTVKQYNDVRDKLYESFDNFIIMKTDGSLATHGIEIVSAPAPFDVHATAWDKFFTDLPTGVISHKRLSGADSTCGIHIHISRKALAVIEIAKIVYFINAKENKRLIHAVAGRYNTKYCLISDIQKPNYETFRYHLAHPDRYNSVNVSNPATIELRIFKGTLNRILFMKNIEFTHALVKFVKSVEIDNLTAQNYIDFVAINGVIYPNLVKFLMWQGFMQSEEKISDEVFKQK